MTFDFNGTAITLEKVYNVPIDIPEEVPAREGYTFLGWSTDSAATNAEYVAGVSYYVNAGTKFYPVWEAIQPQVKYIFCTAWPRTLCHWLLFFFAFGWIWMWFIKP